MRWQLLATLVLAANFACQADGLPAGGSGGATGAAGTSGGSGGHPLGGSGGGATATPAAFEYDGSLAFSTSVVVKPERVQISAPILPRISVIYASFPTTLDGERTMAHDAALLFDWLLPECAPLYPTITLAPADGTPLTQAQLATNYDQVGLCAYMQYVAKPYWVPKLVDDVDICGTEMGPGWRLITEDDLASLSEADFQTVADTWALSAPGTNGLAFFYTQLAIWVRGADGTIQAGTLAPGATGSRVTPLPPGTSPTNHYEGGLALRCIKRTDLP